MLQRCLGLAAAVLIAWSLSILPAAAADKFDDADKAEIEKIVRDYLLANPELLVEIMEVLEAKQKSAAADLARQRIAENRVALFEADGDYVFNADGAVPVVEFFDYQCGYCKRVLPAMQRLLAEQGDVRVIFKEFPILGPVSTYAARAALAARKQGMYLELHNALMSYRQGLSEDLVMAAAAHVGLDLEQLRADMESAEVSAAIEHNLGLANAMGIRGTPTMVIGDNLVPGAVGYDRMVELIDESRSNCKVC